MSREYQLKRAKTSLILAKGLISSLEGHSRHRLERVSTAYFETLENQCADAYDEVKAIHDRVTEDHDGN